MRSRSIAGVTFDLWQTLILDEPEKDLLRRELRCQGLCSALSTVGIDLAFQDLLRGYDESVNWFQTFWRKNEDIPTIEQIRYIVNVASNNKVVLPHELNAIEKFQEAYTARLFGSPYPKRTRVFNLEVSAASGLQDRPHQQHWS